MKSWTYFPAYVTIVAEPIVKSIHMADNYFFTFVTKVTDATKPAFSLAFNLTAEHHPADLDVVSLGLCLEQDI